MRKERTQQDSRRAEGDDGGVKKGGREGEERSKKMKDRATGISKSRTI